MAEYDVSGVGRVPSTANAIGTLATDKQYWEYLRKLQDNMDRIGDTLNHFLENDRESTKIRKESDLQMIQVIQALTKKTEDMDRRLAAALSDFANKLDRDIAGLRIDNERSITGLRTSMEDDLHKTMKDIIGRLDEKITKVDQKVDVGCDKVNSKMAEYDRRIQRIEDWSSTHKDHFAEIKTMVTEHRLSVNTLINEHGKREKYFTGVAIAATVGLAKSFGVF